MSKKRAIVTYEKLSLELRDKLEDAFPEGFGGHMTQITTPTGEVLDALLWETEEIIYLVKLNKVNKKKIVIPEEDEEEEDDIDDIEDEDIKVEDEESTDDDDDVEEDEDEDDDEEDED
jgi:hypothetical protein